MKKLKVDAIKNGTVIDHITVGKALVIAELLNIGSENEMMIGLNLHSEKIGKKDLIKIENKELTDKEMNSIALISPQATLTVIKNFTVEKKSKVKLCNVVEDLITCPNPKCITNVEKNVKTVFYVTHDNEITVRCKYCEKKYQVDEIKIK